MLIPIRCFTCGNVIANRYPKYKEELQKHLSRLISYLNFQLLYIILQFRPLDP